ncbi:hypothetical protein OZ410_09030 [Robiginitalea sp. M366]|uniref:hypothetical protein n=1 Tax=Robiginitalea aestuariiviva TaxID=3036903 RepID=UPI00240E334A|nr:hypothetical protein [Robiginitalea aestuariiviva]MDG1572457.1 hypothetical protein [Robiginitalea aestuariiviva]
MAEILEAPARKTREQTRQRKVTYTVVSRPATTVRKTGVLLAWAGLTGLTAFSWFTGGLFFTELLIVTALGFLLGAAHLQASRSTIHTEKSV